MRHRIRHLQDMTLGHGRLARVLSQMMHGLAVENTGLGGAISQLFHHFFVLEGKHEEVNEHAAQDHDLSRRKLIHEHSREPVLMITQSRY